jgi:lysine 2,3-aminomutase
LLLFLKGGKTTMEISESAIVTSLEEPPSLFKVQKENWKDWNWQIKNSILKIKNIENTSELNLPTRITPYYWKVVQDSPDLLKTVVPSTEELLSTGIEYPLCEQEHSPVKNIVHKYPDRVLFLVTDFCSTNCRYCTRSRIFNDGNSEIETNKWDDALDYIRTHTEIRDVLISGGDPLTMSDEKIEYLLKKLKAIKHVEMIRIGTKVPVVLPQRITPKLVKMLKKYHPLFMSIHFTHPDEITKECSKALKLLANAGIPLGSQTVLLNGVNNNLETMKTLMHKLLMNRVRPYYIYSCDHVSGTKHFWTDVDAGLDIINGLRGYTSGYAVPQFIVDTAEGKIAVSPNNIIEKDESHITLKAYNSELVILNS